MDYGQQQHCRQNSAVARTEALPTTEDWDTGNGRENSYPEENVLLYSSATGCHNQTTVECGLIGYLYIRNKKPSVGSTVIAFIIFCRNRGSSNSIRIKYREIYNPFLGCLVLTPNVILHLGSLTSHVLISSTMKAPDEEKEEGSTTQLSISFGLEHFAGFRCRLWGNG